MAKALIIDDAYGALALAYYSRFGTEPVTKALGVAFGRHYRAIRSTPQGWDFLRATIV
jgi:hypothetical protein